MKKTKLLVLSALVMMASAFGTGCDAGNLITGSKLLSPYVMSFGTLLSWDSVESATSYDIYCDDALLASVAEPSYRVGDLSSDKQFYVVARNEKKQSDKSNTILVSKNIELKAEEILDLSDYRNYSTAIPSTVRKVIVGESGSINHVSLSLAIAARSTDLIFELNQAIIEGSIFTHDASYSRVKNDYSIIFYLNGDCSIAGKDGEAGADFSSSQYDNTETPAGKGQDGGNAIIAPTVVVTGNGNFTVTGGNGGKGGIGSATTTWEATMAPGKGSDGGNGGAGVLTSYFVLDMDYGNCIATVTNGMGGGKGSPGRNSSIITGPMVSMMWNDIYDIGKSGARGQSVFGTTKIINGRLNAEYVQQ